MRFYLLLSMSEEQSASTIQLDRRKGEDRRKGDRRSQERGEEKGILTTRLGEDRRKQNRRVEDRKTEKESQ